jgi:hypothetical protein
MSERIEKGQGSKDNNGEEEERPGSVIEGYVDCNAQLWRLRKERLRLIGSNCGGCGGRHFPARAVCPDCGAS